ncbi:nuclear transport factor 2 family protein [Salinisphaera sp. Q1T1-3]|uniref:nuclear transport factor 2 family protein n=1 Tax=Salinisphaera sp. Q1T1-3 TaxID=2321229 RepID=UPI000E72A748|nr:nuclear transport factor 2 family protein [Salinisphaera sp. Q1T1-3]RJS93610.1 nuclear transport factor 2 family protein [Salinisphaera sp. Q1T1-3]
MTPAAPTDDRLATLLDREAIRELRMAYSHCLDRGDIAGLAAVFAPDARLEVTVGVMDGLPAIQAGLAAAFESFDRDGRGRYPFLHVVANHVVRMTGPDTAEGSCYLIDFETARKPEPDPLLLLGLYHDRYRRIDGSWRISESRLEVVWPPADTAV